MVKVNLFLIALLGLPSLLEARPVEFIFDIDDTLISADIRNLSASTIQEFKDRQYAIEPLPGKVYRISHGAAEVLASLPKVGFFSAHGNDQRSQKIVAHFGPEFSNSTLLTTSQVFYLPDLSDPHAPALQPPFDLFEGEKKKDLSQSRHFKDHDVILIDNDPSHVLRGQEKSFIWVRNKTVKFEMARVRGLIDLAYEYSAQQRISLPEALWQLQWIETSDGQLIYREDICEHPDVYQRGIRILREINPLFDVNASHLSPFEEAHSEEQAKRLVFNSNQNWEQKEKPEGGWRAKLSSIISFLTGRNPLRSIPPAPINLEEMVELPNIGSLFSTDSGQVYQVVMADFIENEIPKFVVRDKSNGSLSLLFISDKENEQTRRALDSRANFYETLATHQILGPKVNERHGNYFFSPVFQSKFSAARWLARADKSKLSRDRKMIALNAFLMDSAAKGIYFSALAPEDLVWTGGQWMLIQKSGTLRQDLSTIEIIERYKDRFKKRWGISVLAGECDSIL